MSRRRAQIQIEMWTFMKALTRQGLHPHYQVHGIPEDAKLLGMCIDPNIPDLLHLYLESESFDEVPEGAEIPKIYIMMSQYICEEYVKGLGYDNSTKNVNSAGFTERGS